MFSVRKSNRMLISGNGCTLQWYFTGDGHLSVVFYGCGDLSMVQDQFSLFIFMTKVALLYEQEPLATVGWLWSNIVTMHKNLGRR